MTEYTTHTRVTVSIPHEDAAKLVRAGVGQTDSRIWAGPTTTADLAAALGLVTREEVHGLPEEPLSAESQNFGNQSQRLDQIRARLVGDRNYGWGVRITRLWADVMRDDDVIARCSDDDIADLIANAPADLAYLLAELDKARAGLAQAWDEGFYAGYADGTDTGPTGPDNPYKEAP